MILPLYEAKTLFANIDAIVPANTAFLFDLEQMARSGEGRPWIGDICLKHVRDTSFGSVKKRVLTSRDS